MKTFFIILSALIITGIALLVILFVLPSTEITLYPISAENTFNFEQIRSDIRFIDTQKAEEYFKGLVGIKNAEIKNYYNFFKKTAYFSQRITFKVIREDSNQ